MDEIIWATPLYEFLRQCSLTSLDRTVLDCGAGSHGDRPPPLLLFYQQGYATYGIEINDEPLLHAKKFCADNGIPLNIFRGDMRRIPFADRTFSFVYSYNAIFFMTKTDVAVAMHEIKRVLRPKGLCFVNFLSVDDPDRRPFRKDNSASRLLGSRRFSRFRDGEADIYFRGFDILLKEKRIIEKLYEGRRLKQAYIDYIARRRR
ncbi:MAG: class I SAM-dependent methyltransferase [candidate division WOR-3 bacterium]|nr:MAG: class I SAM-dependent methyltransferase [candidate division WOR-3 bacterium]